MIDNVSGPCEHPPVPCGRLRGYFDADGAPLFGEPAERTCFVCSDVYVEGDAEFDDGNEADRAIGDDDARWICGYCIGPAFVRGTTACDLCFRPVLDCGTLHPTTGECADCLALLEMPPMTFHNPDQMTERREKYGRPARPPETIARPDTRHLDPLEAVQALRLYAHRSASAVRAPLTRRENGHEKLAGNEDFLRGRQSAYDDLASLLITLEGAMRRAR